MRDTCLPTVAGFVAASSKPARPRPATTWAGKTITLLGAFVIVGSLSACLQSAPEVTAARAAPPPARVDLPLADPLPACPPHCPAPRCPTIAIWGATFWS